MKEIKAIVQQHMLGRILDVLHQCEHFPGVTISDCQGQSRGRGAGGRYEATTDTIFFARKVKLEIFCADAACDHLVDVIRRAARTGNSGDGLIIVADVGRVLRVRSDQEQEEAV